MTAFADALSYAADWRILGFRNKPSIRFRFENGPADRLLALGRHALENLEAGRDDRPGRAARGEDGEGRMEG